MSGLVSVVIPVYDTATYLPAAIRSVLAQDYRPMEVIVVDDGSSDGSAAVARQFPVRLLEQPHSGIGAARNAGIAAAQGEYLAFLDADDEWTSGKLSLQIARLEADPGLDLVFGCAVEFRAEEETAPQSGMLPGTVLLRRTSFSRVGPFRTDLRVGEFIDWAARAREIGLRAAVLPGTVLRRRIHGANTGITQRAGRADYARVVRAVLERRRQMEKG